MYINRVDQHYILLLIGVIPQNLEITTDPQPIKDRYRFRRHCLFKWGKNIPYAHYWQKFTEFQFGPQEGTCQQLPESTNEGGSLKYYILTRQYLLKRIHIYLSCYKCIFIVTFHSSFHLDQIIQCVKTPIMDIVALKNNQDNKVPTTHSN